MEKETSKRRKRTIEIIKRQLQRKKEYDKIKKE